MNKFRKVVHWLLVLALVIGILGFAAQPAQAQTCTQYHTVKKGETLYGIGLKYGVSWVYLADINNLANPRVIYPGQKLCVAQGSGTGGGATPTNTIPTFTIVSVVKNKTVTIQTANFPANDSFNVLMDVRGNRAEGGIKTDTIGSGNGGSFKATFDIPAELKGVPQIAIRLESPTSGYFAYNWFFNTSTGTGTGGGNGNGGSTYTGFPTFSIAAVARNTSVTINIKNLPPNDTFVARMGNYGTKAVGGTEVGSFSSGAGGQMTRTFNIPASLHGMSRIAIRIESPSSGYFAYNWFWNNNAP